MKITAQLTALILHGYANGGLLFGFERIEDKMTDEEKEIVFNFFKYMDRNNLKLTNQNFKELWVKFRASKFQATFRIYSPDGFEIEPGAEFLRKDIPAAIAKFATRYMKQGYYSTIQDGERVQIPIMDIASHCAVKTVM